MKNKIVVLILISFLLNITRINADPIVGGPAAILIDAKTGRVLYERNADTKMYNASTTKIMTGILALENTRLDEVVIAGKNPSTSIERGSSQIYILPDEELTMEQLMYALMLQSANDAAVAIAERISGSVADFAVLMNKKAKELGANNTNFVNPHGLHSDEHYSTARDLALIAKYCMQNEMFRKLVSTYSYSIPATNKQEERPYIRNSNKLINDKGKEYYEFATGIKTGYTTKSKHCLVSGAKKDGMELIAVVLGTDKNFLYPDIVNMFEYGFANYESINAVQKDQIVTYITIQSTGKKINLLAEESFDITILKDGQEKLVPVLDVVENAAPPISRGQVLGKVNFMLGDNLIKSVNLYSEEDYSIPKLTEKVKESFSWKWVYWVVGAFLVLRTIITINKLKKKKSKRSMYIKYVKR